MNFLLMYLVAVFYSLCLLTTATSIEEIRMPNVTADHDDAYICMSRRVTKPVEYLTKLKPIYSEVTHHMLLFLCEEPGSKDPWWYCDEHASGKPTCIGGQKVVFSWAMMAKGYELPPDTSIPIMENQQPYMVLQVHYKDATGFKDLPNGKDNSGWQLTVSDKATKLLAGIYIFVADGSVKPNGETVFTISCPYEADVPLHPFAFRVHAHSHGLLNYAYVETDEGKYLIGAKSPQDEQTYYPVRSKNLTVNPSDQLVAKCLMFNEEHRVIPIGNTRQDEMCNFYMMYSVPADQIDVIFNPATAGCFNGISGEPGYGDEAELDARVLNPVVWD